MRYVCPRCKGISNSKVEVRKDKPKEQPQRPESCDHWALVAFQLEFRVYILDHWNRTVVCQYCGEANHYFKNE